MGKSRSIILMIEGGEPLSMIRTAIARNQRLHDEACEITKELGLTRFRKDDFNNSMISVIVQSGETLPKDWRRRQKSDNAVPKKGTQWDGRLRAHQSSSGEPDSSLILKRFEIPYAIRYAAPAVDGGSDSYGFRRIGNFFAEAGFLWITQEGPYAMWIPDVEAEIKLTEEQGFTVTLPSRDWKPAIEGTRRIENEEWEILVLEHQLKKKKGLINE